MTIDEKIEELRNRIANGFRGLEFRDGAFWPTADTQHQMGEPHKQLFTIHIKEIPA